MEILVSKYSLESEEQYMLDNIVIKKAEIQDVSVAVEIAIVAWQPIFTLYKEMMGSEMYETFYHDWEKSKEYQINNSFEDENEELFVALNSEKIVGFICYRYYEENLLGVIGNNAVLTEYQGNGIGSLMYNYVFENMKAKGIKYAKVSTGGDAAHAPARRAYEKNGFTTKIPSVDYYKTL